MPMSWNHETDAKLLLAILHTTNAKLDYPRLAEYMGPECTEVAVKVRIQRLRKQVNSASETLGGGSSNGAGDGAGDGAGAGAGEGSSSVPSTPEKRKRGSKAGDAKGKDGSAKNSPIKKSPTKKSPAKMVNGEAAEEIGNLPAEGFGAKEME